ncbi:MAG: helix-turn-helix domain-containing protein [Nocardioides sp.]|nr:helix-turn-helix domain-containing protein [Nocardioides sp.]
MNSVSLAEAVDVMGPAHLDQTSFAAAVNVTQAAVSQWLSGRRSIPTDVEEVLRQLGHAWSGETVRLGTDPLGRYITAPVERWTPVFRPRDRFRLGIHLNWSGSASARWFDAEDAGDVIESYSMVLTNGTAADAYTWIEPELLARFLPLFRISNQRRTAWATHLKSLGYTVDDAVEVPRAVV